jgi:methyl-accepting chemotaxis protein
MKDITQQVKRATTEQSQGSRQITQAIEHIAEITGYINLSQRDQLKGVESVRVAVRRIKEVADKNQAGVAAMAASVAALKKLARELQTIIDEFKLH